MQWQDQGFVLQLSAHGESKGRVQVLTLAHGRVAGMVQSPSGSKQRGIYQPGNMITFTWRARLAEHLGSMQGELLIPFAAHCMQDPARLAGLNSALMLVLRLAPEHEPVPAMFELLKSLLASMAGEAEWLPSYALFELQLLALSGYGLDLSVCALTGAREGLGYVSPLTGRAATRDAGAPYAAKLLPLPAFIAAALQSDDSQQSQAISQVSTVDLLDALRLTGYFLEKWVFEIGQPSWVAARHRLMAMASQREAA